MISIDNVEWTDTLSLKDSSGNTVCTLFEMVPGQWECEINGVYNDEIVTVEKDGTQYHCSVDCQLNSVIQPSFLAPSEMIAGETVCVDMLHPHPEAYNYAVYISGTAQPYVY